MRTILLLVTFFTYSFAMQASVSYIHSLKTYIVNKEFKIYGLFYMYDFNKNGKIERDDWIYIANDTLHAYRLMGNKPTANKPFGWQRLKTVPINLNLHKPAGYFVFINFPQDTTLFGTNAFSWIYVTHGKTYKLMQADAQHNFDYLDENGDGLADALSNITYTIKDSGSKIAFYYTPSSNQCNFKRGHGSFYIGVDSWYKGNIIYRCNLDSWQLKKTITIQNIRKSKKTQFHFDDVFGEKILFYDYTQGKVHIQGTFNKGSIDCYEYYHSILPITIDLHNKKALKEVLENWGEGPCDPYFIRTTCPAWYYSDYEYCDINGNNNKELQIHTTQSVDAKITTYWEVVESNKKVDRIYKNLIFKK